MQHQQVLNLIRRKLPTVEYAANSVKTVDIPRDYGILSLMLHLSGTLNIATAAAVALYADTPWSLIEEVSVVLDGKDTIKSLPFKAIEQKTLLDYGSPPTEVVNGITVAAHPFEAFGVLQFQMKGSATPWVTMLYAFAHRTAQLLVRWNDGTKMVDPDATTVLSFTVAPTLKVVAMEASNLPDDIFLSETLTLWERQISLPVTATTTKLQQRLAGGNLYRNIHILATVNADAGAGPAGNDSVINSVTLRRGTEVLENIDRDSLAAFNKSQYGLESNRTGWLTIPRELYGLKETQLDSAVFSDLFLEFDVTKQAGTNTLEIFPEEMIITPPLKPNG